MWEPYPPHFGPRAFDDGDSMTGLVKPAKTESDSVDQPAWSLDAIDPLLERLSLLAEADTLGTEFFNRLLREIAPLGIRRVEVWRTTPPTPTPATNDSTSPPPHRLWPVFAPNADAPPAAPLADASLANPNLAAPSLADPILVQATAHAGQPKRLGTAAILVPWRAIGGEAGVIGIGWADPASGPLDPASGPPLPSPAIQLGIAAGLAEIIARFQTRQALLELQRRLAQRAGLAQRTGLSERTGLEDFAQKVNESLDLRQTAYDIANEGRARLDCDRLSLLLRRGNRWRLAAVSGAEHVHRHSPAAERLELLGKRVAATGQAFWFDAVTEDLPPQISEPLAAYLDASPAIALAILPLTPAPDPAVDDNTPPARPLGLLVAEQFREPLSDLQRETLRRMLGPSTTALRNADRVSHIPGYRLWFRLADRRWLARWTPTALAAAAVLASVIAALLLTPADIRLRARGELIPANRRDVFAPRDGVVSAVLVDSGQRVTAGQPLLELRSTDLDLETQRVEGELDLARQRLAVAQSERLQLRSGDAESRARERRLTAEADQFQQQADAHQKRLDMLRLHREELIVRAPIAGQVLTWNTAQRLTGRPLRRGESLLTVADIDGDWQAELRVPSRQAGRLLAHHRPPVTLAPTDSSNPADPPDGLAATVPASPSDAVASGPSDAVAVALTTDPGNWLDGRLVNWSSRVQIDESGESFLLVTVSLELNSPEDRVPGATAIASIPCGRGSLGQAWFYDFVDAIRLWLPI